LSSPSPGANDNGSGILVLLELAERFSKEPSPHVSIRLLASGAEEAGFFGIKDYLKRHQELAKPETLFINLDCVGGGELHWAIGEGHLQQIPYPGAGLEALSELERRSGMAVLPRIPIVAPTDAGPVAKKGYKVLTLIGLDNKSIPPNFHKASDTFDRLDLAILKRAADIVELFIRNSG
jgi:Zn-dependent M28 family amino/carboxypeptidase